MPFAERAEALPDRVTWGAAILTAIVVAAFAAGIAWMSMSTSGTAKDFTLSWTAAKHLLAGRSPYAAMIPTGVYPFNVPFYYPLPAAVLAIPFVPLRLESAGIAFVAVSFGLAAVALVRDNPLRVAALFSFPAIMAATLGQWSPLLLAATVAPVAQLVLPVKPTLGAAAFVNRPSRLGVILAAAVLVVCFVILPGWLAEWRSTVGTAFANYTSPVRWGHWTGLVMLAALIWWRDGDARLLSVMALVPQLPLFYDQLLVQGVARTRNELLVMVGASWVGGLTWAVQGSPNAGSQHEATGLILLTIYLPALCVVIWRNRKRADVTAG